MVLSALISLLVSGQALALGPGDDVSLTLQEINERGVLRCGVDTGLNGFAIETETGWEGFEVDLCHAYAAAFLNDASAVEFIPLTTADRLDALERREVDILLRNTSWTGEREARRDVAFSGVYYYDGQGFLVPSDLGVSSARELNGARVCVLPQTTSARNLIEYAETYALELSYVEVDTIEAGASAYNASECDAFTSDVSTLAALRIDLETPQAHTILPDIISKEPLGPVVHSGDSRFADAVRWVLHGLIAAEEYGITSDQAAQLSPEMGGWSRLGADSALGPALDLDNQFIIRAVSARGHYGEIFHRNLGEGGALKLTRGLNDQWTRGGLLYAPPLR